MRPAATDRRGLVISVPEAQSRRSSDVVVCGCRRDRRRDLARGSIGRPRSARGADGQPRAEQRAAPHELSLVIHAPSPLDVLIPR
jgi:hypothetical protein